MKRCGSFPGSSQNSVFLHTANKYSQPPDPVRPARFPRGAPSPETVLCASVPSESAVSGFLPDPPLGGRWGHEGEGEDFTRRVEPQRRLRQHGGEHVAFPSGPPVVPGLRSSHDARRRSDVPREATRGHERPPAPPPGSSSDRPRCLEAARTHTMLSTSGLGKKRHVQDGKLHAGEGLCFRRKQSCSRSLNRMY